MTRRDVSSIIGAAVVASPLVAWGQPLDRIPRVGVLIAGPRDQGEQFAAAFVTRMRELGWLPDQNLRVDYRWAVDADPNRRLVREMLALRPDVILVGGSPAFWMHEETSTVPVVFLVAIDPVAAGLVASLAHPGGNLTGFTNYDAGFAGKWIEILKEIAPRITRAAVLYYPATKAQTLTLSGIEATAPSFGVRVTAAPVNDAADIEGAITAFAAEPNGSLIVVPNSITLGNARLILALAARHHLPVMSSWRPLTVDGGLISYGVDTPNMYRQSAAYVDRILKGEKPADLPVQQATKFELVINAKTAKELGLAIPESLLVRADAVIE
ncbi:MAG TPA: ABC transporter substrate-binding protein [Stellaceae bacterium]|nr:ABC transporter substrate-binding protein [Stellaceae bacterium]